MVDSAWEALLLKDCKDFGVGLNICRENLDFPLKVWRSMMIEKIKKVIYSGHMDQVDNKSSPDV